MPFVEKMATGPRPGGRVVNTLQATMQWLENLAFPPCFNTRVADATLLYGAYCSLDMFFLSETKAESHPRLDVARAHLPRDVAAVPAHPAFREFKRRFMNFCAHFGYTRPHPFPADGDALGDPAPPGHAGRGGGSLPPPPPSCRTLECLQCL